VKAEGYQKDVHPILEYATCAWAPSIHTHYNVDKLEAIQRRAVRFVDFHSTSGGAEMLTTL